MSRTLICNMIPNNLVHLLQAPQSVNNFCLSLDEGHCFEKIHSIVPISYYNFQIHSNISVVYFGRRKKTNKISGFFFTAIYNLKCALSARHYDTIWFYNIVNSNILSYILLKYIFRKQVFIILLDYTPNYKKFSIHSYIPYLIEKSFGVISLSKRTNIRHSNIDYIAGIILSEKISKKINDPNKKLRFLFSGVLANHTGFNIALEVFKQMPNCELLVSGIGNIDKNDFSEYGNINYLGYLPYEEYVKIYNDVDVCLSFRDPDFPENDNNFPSKILEYFSYNKIVISTINYPELIDFKYFKCKFDSNEIQDLIIYICNLKREELMPYCINSEALEKNFSALKWNNTFAKIEENVNE